MLVLQDHLECQFNLLEIDLLLVLRVMRFAGHLVDVRSRRSNKWKVLFVGGTALSLYSYLKSISYFSKPGEGFQLEKA